MENIEYIDKNLINKLRKDIETHFSTGKHQLHQYRLDDDDDYNRVLLKLIFLEDGNIWRPDLLKYFDAEGVTFEINCDKWAVEPKYYNSECWPQENPVIEDYSNINATIEFGGHPKSPDDLDNRNFSAYLQNINFSGTSLCCKYIQDKNITHDCYDLCFFNVDLSNSGFCPTNLVAIHYSRYTNFSNCDLSRVNFFLYPPNDFEEDDKHYRAIEFFHTCILRNTNLRINYFYLYCYYVAIKNIESDLIKVFQRFIGCLLFDGKQVTQIEESNLESLISRLERDIWQLYDNLLIGNLKCHYSQAKSARSALYSIILYLSEPNNEIYNHTVLQYSPPPRDAWNRYWKMIWLTFKYDDLAIEFLEHIMNLLDNANEKLKLYPYIIYLLRGIYQIRKINNCSAKLRNSIIKFLSGDYLAKIDFSGINLLSESVCCHNYNTDKDRNCGYDRKDYFGYLDMRYSLPDGTPDSTSQRANLSSTNGDFIISRQTDLSNVRFINLNLAGISLQFEEANFIAPCGKKFERDFPCRLHFDNVDFSDVKVEFPENTILMSAKNTNFRGTDLSKLPSLEITPELLSSGCCFIDTSMHFTLGTELSTLNNFQDFIGCYINGELITESPKNVKRLVPKHLDKLNNPIKP